MKLNSETNLAHWVPFPLPGTPRTKTMSGVPGMKVAPSPPAVEGLQPIIVFEIKFNYIPL